MYYALFIRLVEIANSFSSTSSFLMIEIWMFARKYNFITMHRNIYMYIYHSLLWHLIPFLLISCHIIFHIIFGTESNFLIYFLMSIFSVLMPLLQVILQTLLFLLNRRNNLSSQVRIRAQKTQNTEHNTQYKFNNT